MPLKDCTMSAKSFFRSTLNPVLRDLARVSLMFVVFITTLFTVGCEGPTSKKQVHYAWKTVIEGDWSSHLYDVHFISEKSGWAVGNATEITPGLDFGEEGESLIIHTKDGGKTWHRQNSGVFGKPLRKVYFRSMLEGWCVGEEGVLVHTSDGGNTWKLIETATKHNLNDFFIRETVGWIVGDWGTLLKTTDGGQTFVKVDENAFGDQSLKGIYFVDETHGWIVTYNTPTSTTEKNAGYIYQTTDGGVTWKEQFATETALFNLHFIDNQIGWVVGDRRSVFVTSDGGNTWQFVTDGSNQRHKTIMDNPSIWAKNRCTPLHSTISSSQMPKTAGLSATWV